MEINPRREAPPAAFKEQQSPPNKEEALKTYYKLGDRFWMQIMDGKYHKYGSQVFDQGLHGGTIEKGFYASLVEGCRYASEHLMEKPTVTFYRELHKTLCAHFKGEENNTEMTAGQTGCFRTLGSRCSVDAVDLADDILEMQKHKKNAQLPRMIEYFTSIGNKEVLEEINEHASKEEIEESVQKWKLFQSEVDKKIKTLEEVQKKQCALLNIPEFAHFNFAGDIITLNYGWLDPQLLEEMTQKFFDHYNQALESAVSPEGKLQAIAELFQYLEWLHPFQDGQGRTDLVLMSKLLTENGFHPVILEEPYYSSFHLPADWLNYLKEGLKRWEKEVD